VDDTVAFDQAWSDAQKLQASGCYDKAITSLRECLRLRPGYAFAHGALGLAYLSKGELDVSIEESSNAVELKPDHWGFHYYLAEAYLRKRMWAAALDEARISLRYNAGHPQSLRIAAVGSFNLGNKVRAGEYYEQSLAGDPDHIIALAYAIGHQFRCGKFALALDNFKRLIMLKAAKRSPRK